MTIALLVAWLLYGAGVVGLFKTGLWSDRRAVWMMFTIAAGISVGMVFFRSGLSQLWFQRSVAPVVVLISAWGLAALLPSPIPRRRGAILAATAAVAGLGAYLVSAYAERGNTDIRNATYREVLATAIAPFALIALYWLVKLLRRVARRPHTSPAVLVAVLLGLGLAHVYTFGYDTAVQRAEPQPTPRNQFAPGGVEAATWIADHSDRYDVVATNVHCRKPAEPRCDNRNFWVSAYTERRIVIEGWGYNQVTNDNYTDQPSNADIPAPYPQRLRINDAAFTHPTTATVERLVKAYDVKFLFVSKKYPADLTGLNALKQLLTRTYHNKNYVVFQVR
jgi:hypothetical protein